MSFIFSERISKYQNYSVGLKRSDVILAPFNQKWKRIFSDEAYLIFDILRDESLRLYHIGSTSVSGLDAKPIIDILGSVESLDELDQKKNRLESIGYEYKGEYGIKGRRYCVLYNPEKTTAYVHLHIFENNDPEVLKHLSFRDWLRHSEKDRDAYLKHKKFLVNESNIPRAQYSDAKNEIITNIQSRASTHGVIKNVLAILGAAEGHSKTKEFLTTTYANAEMEVIDISESKVSPYSYGQKADGHFLEIINKAIKSDLIVLATPVYWYSMSGAMKDFVDRFSDLLSGDQKPLGEVLYGKKLKLLSTGSDLNLPMGFEVPFAATAIYFGMDYLGANYKSVR